MIDAILTTNTCNELYSNIIFDQDHFIGSLIMIRSIARNFNKNNQNSEDFDTFANFFFQSAFPLFEISQSINEIKLILDTFNYLINIDIEKSRKIDKTILFLIFSKFSIYQNFNDSNEYQLSLKSILKSLLFILQKELIPISEIPTELLLLLFTISLQLFPNSSLSYKTRLKLSNFLSTLLNFDPIIQFFLVNQQTILDQYFIPIYLTNLHQPELFEKQITFSEPIDFAIDLIQCLSRKVPEFASFLNELYIISALEQYQTAAESGFQVQKNAQTESQTTSNQDQEEALLYARICLAASSLQLTNEMLLHMQLFDSPNNLIRVVQFTITANFQDTECLSQLFPIFISHISDELPIVCQLSAITALRCFQNPNFVQFIQSSEIEGFSIETCITFLYESFLTLMSSSTTIPISTSMNILKSLLKFSQNPGHFTNPILEFLFTELINCISDINSDDSLYLPKILKRICQIIECCSESEEAAFITSFIHELILVYPDFNQFIQEQMLMIFDKSALFCFSPDSWEITTLFNYDILFDDEMIALRSLLISANRDSVFNIELLQSIVENLFSKIGIDTQNDEIAFNSITDILYSLCQQDELSFIINEICQKISPIIIHYLSIDQTPEVRESIANLISAIFLSSNTDEYDIQPFIEFWIENAQFPYFTSSAIPIIQRHIPDHEFVINIFQKTCDDIENRGNAEDDLTFQSLTFYDIIMNFLKCLKFLETEDPAVYKTLQDTSNSFLKETLPAIVDQLLSESE